jgi:hypothetical protein
MRILKQFLLTIIACFLIVVVSKSQTPKSFNFQGIALDSAGFVVSSKPIKIRFSLSADSLFAKGIGFQEVHTTNTDKYGQFTVAIGTGISTIGNFSKITWHTMPTKIFLKTEIDIKSNGIFMNAGVSQLQSVPFANYAPNPFIFKDTLSNFGLGEALFSKNTTGFQNHAVGLASLRDNTTGNRNNAYGTSALAFNTTGQANSGFGNFALNSNTTGSFNVGVGRGAGLSNKTGNNNTAIGTNALWVNTSGSNNTVDRKSTRLNSSHKSSREQSRMPSSA